MDLSGPGCIRTSRRGKNPSVVRGGVFHGKGQGVKESEVGFCMVFISEGRRLY